MELKTDSSPGVDNVTVEIFKLVRDYVCKPLAYNINLSLSSGSFPSNLKNTIITPIYKTGDKSDISNYRPIALVSNISKLIEKYVKKNLVEYLETNNILSDNQYGFRVGKGTEVQLQT